MKRTQRLISKHALILMARGEKEIASQVFVYDHMREIRADVEALEVKVLMDYDQNYHRVFKVDVKNEEERPMAVKMVLDFYNNLLNASMKLTEEEIENLKNQKEAQAEQIKKNIEAAKEQTEESTVETPAEEETSTEE